LSRSSKVDIIEPLAWADPIPVVVLSPSDAISSVDTALDLIESFATVDDVYSQAFARNIVLQSRGDNDIQELFALFKASSHFSAVYHTSTIVSHDALPAGPYFPSRGSIHQAYRLCDDKLDSFIFGVIPEDV
jgi:hypothetical protein